MEFKINKKSLKKNLALSYSLGRTAHFAFQQRALPLAHYVATGKGTYQPPDKVAKMKQALAAIYQLLEKDAENIADELYPIDVLVPENPISHAIRYVDILKDGLSIAKRREARVHHDFSDSSKQLDDSLPEYYTRNFHYQTDGYLSDDSAKLYEHQVEILFAGAADAMRRLLIPLLKRENLKDGEGLNFLELGCGTGRLTKFMALAFPKARITALDPSDAYLARARGNLKKFDRVSFVHGFAEKLPFRDNTFDLVYSCFLFHEVPKDVRKQIMRESRRVLHNSGLVGIVDSLQAQDAPEFDWALERFPIDFHEPFYKDYSNYPIADLITETAFHAVNNETHGFLSKAVVARKA